MNISIPEGDFDELERQDYISTTGHAEECRETPLGEQLDGGWDDGWMDQYDNDPSPYDGTLSEE